MNKQKPVERNIFVELMQGIADMKLRREGKLILRTREISLNSCLKVAKK